MCAEVSLCGCFPVMQTAEAVRLRCLEAQELVCHLQAFSCHGGGTDFRQLPSLFTNDATLAEAAVSLICSGVMRVTTCVQRRV